MLLAIATTALLAASPARPALHLLPNLAETAETPVDPFRSSVSPGEVLAGIGFQALTTVLMGGIGFGLGAVFSLRWGAYAIPVTMSSLLGMAFAGSPWRVVQIQSGIAGRPIAGSEEQALRLGYLVQLLPAACLVVGLVWLPTFPVMVAVASALNVFAMPVLSSLGLHLELGPPPSPLALRFSF